MGGIKLWPNQARAVTAIRRLFSKWGRVLAVGPTGSGKTVIGAAYIRSLPSKTRVLWLAHRGELLSQTIEHLVKAGIPREDIGLLSGDRSFNVNARVLVAGVGMFRTREAKNRDLIVIDEAHHAKAASYQAILAELPNAKVLGLTATPLRLDSKPLGDIFEHLFIMVEAEELIADGYISRSRIFGIPKAKARELVRGLASHNGDWGHKALERAMRRGTLTADIVTEYKRLANGRSTICYATTVVHAKDLCLQFRKGGVTCEVVSWETDPAQRAAILARLKSGETKVVVNVMVFTEGVDCPEVRCIIMARPTQSLTLYRQMCGRASRGHGKRYFVLDMVGNAWRHGFPEAPVAWSLADEPPSPGDAPMKLCVQDGCGCMMPIAQMVCPECGAEQPEDEAVVAERKARLEELLESEAEKKRRVAVIHEIAKARGWAKEKTERAVQVLA